MSSQLTTNAVLMRLSKGLPGENRHDKGVTEEVKQDKHLGQNAGRWIKSIYPPEALKPIKELDDKIDKYHKTVTLPFDEGIGILPAACIVEYGDQMRLFKGQREHLVESHFLARFDEWVVWARQQHNGTFDLGLYDRDDAAKKFFLRVEPLPVPSSAHFENTVSSLLGMDTAAVDRRIEDAAMEAQKELMRRMIAPVQNMAKVLSKDSPRIFDTLIGNIKTIADLVPKLNLSGDPKIDEFGKELTKLTSFTAQGLRSYDSDRADARKAAEAVLQKLSGYKL